MEKEYNNKYGIVFVADHWGKFCGGIDVFNESLCKAMAYVIDHSSVAVICLVFGMVENHYIAEYKEKGIYIIDYIISAKEDENDICTRARKEIESKVPCNRYIWIGHDLCTGPKALIMSKISNNREKCALIFHTDYFSMHINQSDILRRKKDGNDYNRKSQMQEDLAEKADWIFCVGPVVYKCFKNLDNVYEIIPGLDINMWRNNPGEYNLIMTAGRFDSSTNHQKKWTEVCYAIGEALDYMFNHGVKPLDYKVILYGFSQDYKNEDLEEIKNEIISDIRSRTTNNISITIALECFDEERMNI